jgi:16S rRNA (adenine1518-N6/adenine1519-N6)-dimethyltransferase
VKRTDATALRAAGLRPKKSLGQNFLEDPRVLGRIVDLCQLPPGAPPVVEVGAGLGALTAALAGRGAHVVALERDRELCPLLRARFAETPLVEVVEGDALAADLRALHQRLGPLTLCGNIPYNLTSPLLAWALGARETWVRTVFMVQREVADRLVSPPGGEAYGALTVSVGAWLTAQRALLVSAGAFHPPPKVGSAVVVLQPRATVAPGVDSPAFSAVVRATFSRRRKTLRNGLKLLVPDPDRVLDEAGVDGSLRPEVLGVAEFGRLALALEKASPVPGGAMAPAHA